MERRQSVLTRIWHAHYGGRLARELALLAVMLYAYKYVRFLVNERSEIAFANAKRVLQWEHWMLLDSESTLQQLILPHRDIVVGLNRYYVTFHFIGTMAFLVWAFARSLQDYTKVRRVLLAVTAGALVMHVAFPLAPPRMMPGFVDTMAQFGPNPYHSEGVREFANQYAAMPSLHVGWAIIVAYGVIRISKSRFRWFIVAHPVMTMMAVVLTANHYWLDGIVAAALVAWAVWVLYRPPELALLGRRITGAQPQTVS